MEELISKIIEDVGLTEEQAKLAVKSIKEYVVEKYPLLEGVVKNMLKVSESG